MLKYFKRKNAQAISMDQAEKLIKKMSENPAKGISSPQIRRGDK